MRTEYYFYKPKKRRRSFDEEDISVEEEALIRGFPGLPEEAFDTATEINVMSVTQNVAAIQEVAAIDDSPSICHIIPVISSETLHKFVLYEAETADVNFEFTINGKTTLVPAHKCLLAHQSAVFRQMFFGEMKHDVDIFTLVKIDDATPDEFIEFAKCFYFVRTEITAMNIRAMTYLTHKYNVKMFERRCKSFLYRMASQNTVSIFWVLPIATLYNYDEVQQECINLIHSNGQLLMECLKFANCSLETLKSVLNIHFNDRDEARVFDKCISWAKESCEQKKMDPTSRESIRNQLGDCFELIRFESMSPSQFTKCLSKHPYVFLPDEIGNIAKTVKGQEREFGIVVVPPVKKVRGSGGKSFEPTLRKMVFDVDTADVFFTFGSSPGKDEKRIAAHKCMLSANSSIFKDELRDVKKLHTFHVTDASYEEYLTVIKMLYGYTKLLKHYKRLSNESINKVLMLLKKYKVRFRHQSCSSIDCIEDELMTIQNDENLLWLLELSRIHSLEFLHCLCINRIENGRVDFSSESFLNLCQESFKTVFSLVLKKNDAAAVCVAGKKWAEAFCIRNQLEVSGENIRMALGDFWSIMPFGCLEPVEFIRYRRDLGNIFTSEEIKNIIDTMANEYETDESDMSMGELEVNTNEIEADTNMDDSDDTESVETCDSEFSCSSMETDDESPLEDEDYLLSEGELESLKSEL